MIKVPFVEIVALEVDGDDVPAVVSRLHLNVGFEAFGLADDENVVAAGESEALAIEHEVQRPLPRFVPKRQRDAAVYPW